MGAEAHLRRATLDDLNSLVELEQVGFATDRFSKSQYRHLITHAKGIVFVIEQKGALMGSAALLWRKGSQKARLYSIVVAPDARGRGLGHMLLEACEDEARRHGLTALTLQVRADNKSAIEFYARHGFVESGRLLNYYDDQTDGLEMRKCI